MERDNVNLELARIVRYESCLPETTSPFEQAFLHNSSVSLCFPKQVTVTTHGALRKENMQEPYKNPVHASFRLDIKFPITVKGDGDLFQLWQSLSYRIMRQSDDLLTHTRRIRLCQEPALNDRLAGALADLEHVLNGRGTPLLQRLRTESLRAVGNKVQLPGLHSENPDEQAISKGRVLPTMTQLLQVSIDTASPRPMP